MAAYQPVSDPTAVFGRRVVATLIDGAVVLVPTIAAASAPFEYLTVDQLNGVDPQVYCDQYMELREGMCINAADVDDRVYFSDGNAAFVGILLWLALFSFLVRVVLEGLTGWTPGKLLTGIRTVRADGQRAGLLWALVRWLFRLIDRQPCGLPLVGFITALTTTGHRRVGDMVAKTFVVRSSAVGTPVAVPGLTAPPPSPIAYGTAPWSTTTPPGPVGVTPPVSSDPTGPQWDPARNTYIQWDPTQSRWLQWDEGARTWSPIPDQ